MYIINDISENLNLYIYIFFFTLLSFSIYLHVCLHIVLMPLVRNYKSVNSSENEKEDIKFISCVHTLNCLCTSTFSIIISHLCFRRKCPGDQDKPPKPSARRQS